MKIIPRRAGALFLMAALFAAHAALAQTELRKVESPGNRVFFSTENPATSARGIEMRKRLSDPQLRAELRAETRASIREQNPEVAEVLGLDADVEGALLDVLTDQQMAHLEWFWSESGGPASLQGASPDQRAEVLGQHTASESRAKEAIRTALGPERFERYIDYTTTLVERRQAAHFESRLAPADRLTPDQKERLMAVLRVHNERRFSAPRGFMSSDIRGMLPAAAADRDRILREHTISMSERSFRQMQRESRRLLAELPPVLNSRQLEAYEKMEVQTLDAQRKHIQQLRVDAGLAAEFDETTDDAALTEQPLAAGKVRLELSFRANTEAPVNLDVITENGKPAEAFAGTAGLWVEATPTLYADGSGNVFLRFYEESQGRRRLLAGGMGVGQQNPANRLPPGLSYDPRTRPLGASGSRSTISGSKAYAVALDARVSSAP